MSTLPPVDIGLIERLRDEAALCRNETATDVAELLEEAVDALTARDAVLRKILPDLEAAVLGKPVMLGPALGEVRMMIATAEQQPPSVNAVTQTPQAIVDYDRDNGGFE